MVNLDHLEMSLKTMNACQFLSAVTNRNRGRIACKVRREGVWQDFTFERIEVEAKILASYLIHMGLKRGERVAILSASRPEYIITFFGIALAGAIAVPIDAKLTVGEVVSIIQNCSAAGLLVSPEYLHEMKVLREHIPSLRIAETIPSENIFSFQPKIVSSEVSIRSDEVVIITYTSGTTQNPKGVMLKLSSFLFEIEAIYKALGNISEARVLSILPMSHLFEFTAGMLYPFSQGTQINYANTLLPTEIIERIGERRITHMLVIPLFLRTLMNAILREAGRNKRKLFLFNLQRKIASWIPSMWVRRRMFAPLHKKLGGEFSTFVSGGAALEPVVQLFFEHMGIHVLQGYGLSETGPAITFCKVGASRVGSVGKPLDGIDLRTDPQTGEIMTRGPHVAAGYYLRSDLTAESFDAEGWFKTGDVGHIDNDGFLFITGRSKDLIVLPSGKKVFPDEVEAIVQQSPLMKDVCIIGATAPNGPQKGQEAVCCVVVPNEESGQTIDLQQIEQEIRRLTSGLAQYKRPSVIIIRREEIPKTTTRKVKRALLKEWINNQGA